MMTEIERAGNLPAAIKAGARHETPRAKRGLIESMTYTLDDLAAAEARYAEAERRVDNYDGNNPNRGRSELRRAGDHLTLVTLHLQAKGLLPKPELDEKQKLEQALDAAFPSARSKEIVEYQGKRYQRRFAPGRMSRSRKSVTEWSKWWEDVTQ